MTTAPEDNQRRGLPRCEDAETWVLGACLRTGVVVPELMSILPVSALYSARHQIILAAMYAIASRGDHVDLVTTAEQLLRQKELQVAGGELYLMELADMSISSVGLKSHARIIVEYWISRQIIELTRRLHDEAWDVACDFPRALALMRDLAVDLSDKSKLLDRLIASEVLR